MTEFEKTMAQDTMMFEGLEEQWDMEREISEYEASQQEMAVPEEVDTRTAKLTRQRNSRRKAAAKNADFKEKKSAKKELQLIAGRWVSKPKAISEAKTARRRAERRSANKLIAVEQE